MRAVETIKNIWKIEDLRNRILTTLLLVVIYRFGTFVVLPGIDPKALTALQEQTQGGLLALLDMFSGGAFSNASIFALGIMPYISASIVMQLMAIAVPSFQKLQPMDTLFDCGHFVIPGPYLFGKLKCAVASCWRFFTSWNLVYDIFYNHFGCRKYVYPLVG